MTFHLSIWAALAALAVALVGLRLWWYLRHWIASRATAAGTIAANAAIATHQAQLNESLQQQKAELIASGDQQRSSLHREATDYAIYTARKHEAIAKFFAGAIDARRSIEVINALAGEPESARHAYQVL